MLTDVAGIAVGHWTDRAARTGTTVVLLPPATVASAEVRGGAPASRELDLLAPERTVDRVDAVVLTGGSAFGLAAADGAMAWCEEQGRGFETPAGRVPIVPALAVFDLDVGDPSVRPGAAAGRGACDAAAMDRHEVGVVGVGTGCTVGAWWGAEHRSPGGVVTASRTVGELVVAVLVAVNAAGDVDPDGQGAARWAEEAAAPSVAAPFANTTIGVVATNARLGKADCLLVAQSAHDGLARSVFPTHTAADGDAFVATATGTCEADVSLVRLITVALVESAIRSLAVP